MKTACLSLTIVEVEGTNGRNEFILVGGGHVYTFDTLGEAEAAAHTLVNVMFAE